MPLRRRQFSAAWHLLPSVVDQPSFYRRRPMLATSDGSLAGKAYFTFHDLRTTIRAMEQTATVWDDLVGHEWAVDLMQGAIAHGRVGHAYLFTGPEQIGKTALARTFVQALNCEAADPGARPCGQCRACTLIAADRHPDVRLLHPEVSGRGQLSLKIEQIRDLQRDLNLAAYEARRKAAIVTNFQAASQGAANAFLKTLEEPPGDVVLLLTAVEADALLPTITSRCRVVALRPLPVERIVEALERRWHLPPEKARLLSHLADGRLGWALDALEDPDVVQERAEKVESLLKALRGGRVERFALAEKLAKDPEALTSILQTWLTWWRDLAMLAWGGRNEAITNVDRRQELIDLARRWDREAAVAALKQTRTALWQLEHNANVRLVLENLFLTYPYLKGETARA